MEEAPDSDPAAAAAAASAADSLLSLHREHRPPAQRGGNPTAVTGSQLRRGDEDAGDPLRRDENPVAAALRPPPESARDNRRERGTQAQAPLFVDLAEVIEIEEPSDNSHGSVVIRVNTLVSLGIDFRRVLFDGKVAYALETAHESQQCSMLRDGDILESSNLLDVNGNPLDTKQVSALFDPRARLNQRPRSLPRLLQNLGSVSQDNKLQLNFVRPQDATASTEPKDAYVHGPEPSERNDTTQEFTIRFDNIEASALLRELKLKRGFVHGRKVFYVDDLESNSPLSDLVEASDCLVGINGASALSVQTCASPEQEATALIASVSSLSPPPIIKFERHPTGVVFSDSWQPNPASPVAQAQNQPWQRPHKSEFLEHGGSLSVKFDAKAFIQADSVRPIATVEASQLSPNVNQRDDPPLTANPALSYQEGFLLNIWGNCKNELNLEGFQTEDDFNYKNQLVNLSDLGVRWLGADFTMTIPHKRETYGIVVGYSGAVETRRRRRSATQAASNNHFLVAFVTIAGRLSAVKLPQATCHGAAVYEREHGDEPTIQHIPNLQNLVENYGGPGGSEIFLHNEDFLSFGRQVDLDRMLGPTKDGRAPDHVAGTKGQVIAESTDKKRVLIAYQKRGNDDDDITWEVFDYSASVASRSWSAFDDEVTPTACPLFGMMEAITAHVNHVPDTPLEDMEPEVMRDDRAARISTQLFCELMKIRMFGDKNMFEAVMRDYPQDKEEYDEHDKEIIDRRLAKIDLDITNGTIAKDTSDRYSQHVNYRKEEFYPLSPRVVDAVLGDGDRGDFSYNPLNWFVSSRYRIIRFEDAGDDKYKVIECNPKDGDGYAHFFLPTDNFSGSTKGFFIPRNYAAFFTFSSLFSCTAQEFKKYFGILDHIDLSKENDLPLNQGPMNNAANNRARHIPHRNNKTGIVGVNHGADGLYYISSVEDGAVRITTSYAHKYLAANHRWYLEVVSCARAHLSVNHLIHEILHGEGWLHLISKEYMRRHLFHRDFDQLKWDAYPGNSYDMPDLETGDHIDFVKGVINDLSSGAVQLRPILNGDFLVHQVDKSDTGELHDHLLEAMHEALIQKGVLLPCDSLEAYVHRHFMYAQSQCQFIMTKNRLSIEKECNDVKFKDYLRLRELPRLDDGSLDLASLPPSEQGKYELLTAAAMNGVCFVIWNHITDESTENYNVFKNTARYDAPGYSKGVIHIASCTSKWCVLNIKPYERPQS